MHHYIFKYVYLVLVFNFMYAQDKKVLIIGGTRPEIIKLAPVYLKLKKTNINTYFCNTGQHADLADSAFRLFDIIPDYNLNIMRPNQSLSHVTTKIIKNIDKLLFSLKPNLVLVQGDTTTAMAGALTSFYHKIPVVHVEAGLRTYDNYDPFPEEFNRALISKIACLHCAPTQGASDALKIEGILKNNIIITDNTIVDALCDIKNRINNKQLQISDKLKKYVDTIKKHNNKLVVFTFHRRESLQKNALEEVLKGLLTLLDTYQDLYIVYPVHPNPEITRTLDKEYMLKTHERCLIVDAISYENMVYLLENSYAVITDSGGIQEEAVSLKKPVFVLREKTERQEAIQARKAFLVGTCKTKLVDNFSKFIENKLNFSLSSHAIYGDGLSAQKIVQQIILLLK